MLTSGGLWCCQLHSMPCSTRRDNVQAYELAPGVCNCHHGCSHTALPGSGPAASGPAAARAFTSRGIAGPLRAGQPERTLQRSMELSGWAALLDGNALGPPAGARAFQMGRFPAPSVNDLPPWTLPQLLPSAAEPVYISHFLFNLI